MDLTPYLESLRRQLAAAAAPAGESAAQAADLLASTLEPAARLSLLEALSDAAAEITSKLDTATVEVRLRGRDADLVVSDTSALNAPATAAAAPPPPPDGGDVSRITLRLPEQLKEQVERVAATEGVSVNTWLVRAISTALHAGSGWQPPFPPHPPHPPQPPFPPGRGRGRGNRLTGFAQA